MRRPVSVAKRVENVVAEARLGGPFDILALADRVPDAQYRPDRFIGLILQVRGGSALVFEDGHVVTTGAQSLEAALAQMEQVREQLAAADVETSRLEGFHVRNVVVSADLGQSLALDEVQRAYPGENMAWDATQFPGLIWRQSDPSLTLLLFPSGKVVGTNSSDNQAVVAALDAFAADIEGGRLIAT